MIGKWLAALEATPLAVALSHSTWTYPLVNAAHILGVALLLGSIIPLDLRLLGLWRSVPLAPLWRVLTRTAGTGLGLAMICGILLFATRAAEYAASSLFIAKMVVVGVGIANALAVRLMVSGKRLSTESATELSSWRIRIAAGLSLAVWLTALTLGRLVGFF